MQFSTLPVDVAAAHQIVGNSRWGRLFVFSIIFCTRNCSAIAPSKCCSFSVY